MMHKWDPLRALQLIDREKVTNFVGVPTMSHDLISHPDFDKYDTSSLKNVGGGGAHIWHPHDAAWDGETIGAFWQRTGEAAEAIWQAGGRPLVVSHVGTTQGILRWTMRIPPDAPDSFSLFVGNASLTEVVVRVDRHGRRRAELHRLGSAEHLSNVTDI